jgi:two-component system sensor histidine kinase UhpB
MKNLVLVDDDHIIHSILQRQLEHYDYKIHHYYSGEEFLSDIDNSHGSTLAILMDINMGKGLSGPQTAERMQQKYDIPILFHSSHDEKEIAAETGIAKSYGYLVKGTAPIVIDAAIKSAIHIYELAVIAETHRKLYAHIFDICDNPITIMDANDGHRIIDCNEAFLKITDHSREDIIGKSPTELGLWKYESERTALYKLSQKQSSVHNFRHTMITKHGTEKIGYLSTMCFSISDKLYRVAYVTEEHSESNQQLVLEEVPN